MVFNSSMLMAGATANASGYSIPYSCRFVRGNSAYLNRTPAGVGTSRRIFTVSTWMKLADVSTAQAEILHVGSASGTSNSDWLQFYYDGNKFKVGGWSSEYLATTAVYRDPSAWMHVVLAVDTTQATAANRMRLYVNGLEVTAFTTASYPTLNQDTPVNNTQQHNIGARTGGSVFYDGYLSNYYLIDGQQLTPSSFGQKDISGMWTPKAYAGTYGTNGFFLAFGNSAALGTDTSGNANTFTSSGLVAGDQFADTPTLNVSTLNKLWTDSTLTSGNLIAASSGAAAYEWNISTFALPTTGKWVFEATRTAGTFGYVGICQLGKGVKTGNDYIYAINVGTGEVVKNATSVTTVATPGAGVVRVEYNSATDKLEIFTSGSSVYSITGAALTSGGGSLHFLAACYQSATFSTNFGANAFAGTPTTGYVALNSYNLPAPAIKDGSAHFQPTLYTSNGSTLTVTQSGNSTFEPGLAWLKMRTDAGYSNRLFDIVRGATKHLRSNGTDAETTTAASLTAFNSNGFSLGSYSDTNESGSKAYVAWQWKAGGAGVSNTSGSITSTVSANTTAGFSVVTYTGTGANATVGHGLGLQPKLIIVKKRGAAGTDWPVLCTFLGAGYHLYLDLTNGVDTNPARFTTTNPTSTVFSLGTNTDTNLNTSTYVAYCFAEISGFSQFGSYTGNGSANGPFVYTGFRPAYVLIKKSSAVGEWHIYDTARGTYNLTSNWLNADTTGAESGAGNNGLDILSSGFKLRSADGNTNTSTATYVYIAFAERPFGGSGAAPATAR